MTGTSTPQPALRIERYHRSETNARTYVKELLDQFGVTNFGTKLAASSAITIQTAGGPIQINPRQEVFKARTSKNVLGPLGNRPPMMPRTRFIPDACLAHFDSLSPV